MRVHADDLKAIAEEVKARLNESVEVADKLGECYNAITDAVDTASRTMDALEKKMKDTTFKDFERCVGLMYDQLNTMLVLLKRIEKEK